MHTKTSWLTLALVACCLGCKAQPPPPHTDGPPQDLLASAARFYDAYARDLRGGHGGALAQYYAPEGAFIAVAGHRMRLSRSSIDSIYRTSWQGPAYFEWDSLTFDSLSPSLVLVTGGFRWQAADSRDTTPFIYVSLLEAVDSGLALRFEHETPKPRPKK
jgi:hypothetical protein